MSNDCGTMFQVGLSKMGKLDDMVKEEILGGSEYLRHFKEC